MFTIAALALAASLPVIDSIRIVSRWNGYGTPSATTYTIVRRGDRYQRELAEVSQIAVNRFAAAITAAPVQRNTALRRLATPEWLMAHASERHDDAFVPVCSPEAKRLLAEHLSDPEEAVAVFDQYFSARWTDDPPVALKKPYERR